MKIKPSMIAAFVLFLTPLALADAKQEVLAIVVNLNSPLQDVSGPDLVKIFRGEKAKGPDGTRFTVVLREPGSPERVLALARIYGMTEQTYQRYFLQATFTGAVQSAPRKMKGAAGVKQFVASNPGAIGHLLLQDVDDSVKVLKIDGKAPGEGGYKLPHEK